jgi:predicted GNAT family N-acyltransferase
MDLQFQFATTTAEREAIYRLRYEIYVEERHAYKDVADHENRLLSDTHDPTARLLYATVGGEVVGSLRLNWGADAPFTKEIMATYDIQRFLPTIPMGQMIIFSRFMIRPDYRKQGVSFQFLAAMFNFFLENGLQLAFCDCRPHLINSYVRLGFRTYTQTYNDPIAGLLVPLVMVIKDRDHFEEVGSPLTSLLEIYSLQSNIPAQVAPLIPQSTPVQSNINSRKSGYWSRVHDTLMKPDVSNITIFDDLSDDETARFMTKSHIIKCSMGDKIVSRGSNDRTVFIILSGVVEIKNGDQVIAVQSKGNVIGEVAFLLRTERMADVYAASDNVKVLSLSEKTLQDLIESEPTIAARLLHNLAKILSMRLVSLSEYTFSSH